MKNLKMSGHLKTFKEYFNESIPDIENRDLDYYSDKEYYNQMSQDNTQNDYPYAVWVEGPIASNIFIKDSYSNLYANVYYKYNLPEELASNWKKFQDIVFDIPYKGILEHNPKEKIKVFDTQEEFEQEFTLENI